MGAERKETRCNTTNLYFKKTNKIAFESQWALLLTLRTFSPIWCFVFPNQGGQTQGKALGGMERKDFTTRAFGLQLVPKVCPCRNQPGVACSPYFILFYFFKDRFSSRGFYAIKIQQKLPRVSWWVLNPTGMCQLWGCGWNIPAVDLGGCSPKIAHVLMSPFVPIPVNSQDSFFSLCSPW